MTDFQSSYKVLLFYENFLCGSFWQYIYIYYLLYTLPCTVAHAEVALFSKKNNFFLNPQYFLPNKWEKWEKSNGNVVWDTFLDFSDVSSYLAFNLSAWKRAGTTSFELQIPQTSSTPFWKAQSFTKESKNWNLSMTRLAFTGRCIFRQFLHVKCYNFFLTV